MTPHEDQSYLSAPSPDPSNNGSNETFIDPSPIAPSSNGTEFADLDEVVEHPIGKKGGATKVIQNHNHNHTLPQPELTVGNEKNIRGMDTD